MIKTNTNKLFIRKIIFACSKNETVWGFPSACDGIFGRYSKYLFHGERLFYYLLFKMIVCR